MNLYELAKMILVIEDSPISKVRFAKTIYFVHKELIRLNIAEPTSFKYVRMPLGPVPDGFMQLANIHRDILTTVGDMGLSYNSINYSTKKKKFSFLATKNPLHLRVEGILNDLRAISTSNLVEISHEEPSWKEHKNSETYFITDADMIRPFPVKSKTARPDTEDHLLQASLIKGMLDDIVSESTDLEYPEDGEK